MTTQDTGTTDAGTLRTVDLAKIGEHLFAATNVRGGTIRIGEGEDADFSPVELLLTAMAACGALDVDYITGKRAPFETVAARAEGHKIRDSDGNHLVGLRVTYDVTFPEGEAGDAAREILPTAIERSQNRLCTVGRTLTLGSPVSYVAGAVEHSLPGMIEG